MGQQNLTTVLPFLFAHSNICSGPLSMFVFALIVFNCFFNPDIRFGAGICAHIEFWLGDTDVQDVLFVFVIALCFCNRSIKGSVLINLEYFQINPRLTNMSTTSEMNIYIYIYIPIYIYISIVFRT